MMNLTRFRWVGPHTKSNLLGSTRPVSPAYCTSIRSVHGFMMKFCSICRLVGPHEGHDDDDLSSLMYCSFNPSVVGYVSFSRLLLMQILSQDWTSSVCVFQENTFKLAGLKMWCIRELGRSRSTVGIILWRTEIFLIFLNFNSIWLDDGFDYSLVVIWVHSWGLWLSLCQIFGWMIRPTFFYRFGHTFEALLWHT